MPSNALKAFVSSTYEDLKEHRAHVIRTLRRCGIFVDPMEDWTADANEPKRFSQDRMVDCDFCVLLVAFRRGYVPAGETRSITQLEYQAAIERPIDVLVYLLDERAAWEGRFDDRSRDPAIGAWRAELAGRHGRELFGPSPSSLDVAPAITRWITKRLHPVVAGLTGLATELGRHEAALRERRSAVTSYLQTASDLIEHAHDELQQRRVPHGTCQQIYSTGELLVGAIGDAISPDDAKRLAELLHSAYQVEMLHDALRDDSARKLNLAELDRARGAFAALLEAIRVSPLAGRG